MNPIQFKPWLLLFAIFSSFTANSADIDLFAGVPTSGSGAPYVVLVIDTGASFSANNDNPLFRCNIDDDGLVKTNGTGDAENFTKLDRTNGGVEQCALYSVIKALDPAKTAFNIGVMMFNSGQRPYNAVDGTFSTTACTGTGGCLVMPIVTLTDDMNSTKGTKAHMLDWIRKWEINGNSNYVIKAPANRGDGATMQETWAYYAGKTGISGRDYASIMPVTGCASKNVIFIGNNYDTQASPQDSTNNASSPLMALNGTISVIGKRASPAATSDQLATINDTITTACKQNVNSTNFLISSVPTAENKGALALNWTAYMKSQDITTFSVGLQGPTCDATFAAQMEKMGDEDVGTGGFTATSDFSKLVDALNNALGKIQTKNSTFAAVSLPVSVNTQGTYLNQIYIGMFRPAQSFDPLWFGNLKQYKLGQVGDALKLLDANGDNAIDTGTGFITGCARSFWTPNTVDTYWDGNSGTTDCLTIAGAKNSNYPDGNIVEKGAQAYKLRAVVPIARNVKTCSSPVFASCGTTLSNFDANLSTTDFNQNLFDSTSTVTRDTLINWARGTNTKGDVTKSLTEMRPSVHGDVVHSRPMPVNYGTDTAPSVVVYYGANDGMLHAVNGNRSSDITSNSVTYTAGSELWSFMPPEFYGKIKRLYDNAPAITYPGSSQGTATEKDYGFDGPITSLKDSGNTYIYATMRRGGRVVYAFNVTTPGNPTLLWKKGCPINLKDGVAAVDTGCSDDYSGIGQTWSSLKTLYATGYGAGASPLLIMSGGYDPCEDIDNKNNNMKNHECAKSSTKGSKVYVVDALSGVVVKSFTTDRSVVADSTIVVDSDGKAKYAYTADLGGNVYRLTFGSGAAASWNITKIASLGCSTPAGCTDSTANRKFMFAPSVVTTDSVTYTLLLGSGDREKPVVNYLASYAVTNYFFMLQDKPTDTSWLTSESAGDAPRCGASSMICLNSLLAITAGTPPANLGNKKGWYLGLAAHEQVVTSAITIFGVTTFSTQVPQVSNVNTCTSGLGTTRVYNLSYENAASANGSNLPWEYVAGNGLPPSPVGGLITLDGVGGAAGKTVPFCIGCSGNSPLEGKKPTGFSTVNQPKNRLYWYIQK